MSLPAIFNPNRPSPDGTSIVNAAPSEIAGNLQALADIFGIPTSPSQVTAPAMSITAGGVVSIAQSGATVAADPTNVLGIATKQYVDAQGTVTASVSGTNDYSGNTSIVPASQTGLRNRVLLVTPTAANTGNVTLNLNSFGAFPVLDIFDSQLKPGQFAAGIVHSVVFDGANYIIQNPAAATYFGFATNNNDYTVTLTPTPPSLAAIQWVPITVQAEATNTGAVTLNFNSLGAVPLVGARGQALAGGEFVQSSTYVVVFDGASCLLQGSSSQIITTASGGAILFGPGIISGQFVSIGGSATATFNFPTTFPHGVFAGVAANQTQVTANPPTVLGFTASTFTLHNPAATTVICYFIAVGW